MLVCKFLNKFKPGGCTLVFASLMAIETPSHLLTHPTKLKKTAVFCSHLLMYYYNTNFIFMTIFSKIKITLDSQSLFSNFMLFLSKDIKIVLKLPTFSIDTCIIFGNISVHIF